MSRLTPYPPSAVGAKLSQERSRAPVIFCSLALTAISDRRGDAVGVVLGGRRLVGRDRRRDDAQRHLVASARPVRRARRGRRAPPRPAAPARPAGRRPPARPRTAWSTMRDPGVTWLARERVGEVERALGERIGVERDLRRQRYTPRSAVRASATNRSTTLPSRPIGQRLGDHRVDVRAAADLGERDGPLACSRARNVTDPSPR